MLDHHSLFVSIWRIIEVINSIISSYLYIWLAHFGLDNFNKAHHLDFEFWVTQLTIESIATISIFFRFITSYVPDNSTFEITDHY